MNIQAYSRDGVSEKRVRNITNLLDWHRELFGAGQILGKLKLWGSELAGDWRRSRRSWSLLLQELRKILHKGRNLGDFGISLPQKDKLTSQ